MTDLRDQLADFEAAARRLLARPIPRGLALVYARPADCHPDRPLRAQGLCHNCYTLNWQRGTLPSKRVTRSQADFVADYVLLRSAGQTRREIAARLGMTYDAVGAAYNRALRAGALTRDRRPA